MGETKFKFMDKIHIFEFYPAYNLTSKYYVIDNNRFSNFDLNKILARKLQIKISC